MVLRNERTCGEMRGTVLRIGKQRRRAAEKGLHIMSRRPSLKKKKKRNWKRWEDAPTLLKLPKSECPDISIRLPRYKWPKARPSIEELVVPPEWNFYGHSLAGLLWKDSSKRFYSKMGGESTNM